MRDKRDWESGHDLKSCKPMYVNQKKKKKKNVREILHKRFREDKPPNESDDAR